MAIKIIAHFLLQANIFGYKKKEINVNFYIVKKVMKGINLVPIILQTLNIIKYKVYNTIAHQFLITVI